MKHNHRHKWKQSGSVFAERYKVSGKRKTDKPMAWVDTHAHNIGPYLMYTLFM